MSFLNQITVITFVLTFFSFSVFARELPLWEAGAGVGAIVNPHYLGADQNSTYVLPSPYFVYRGEWIRADRSGIRGLLYNSGNLEVNLSFSGSLPVDSEDNDARTGMDDLDLLLEVGPTLQYTVYKTEDQLLRLDLPVRGAFTVGDKFLNHQGWTTNPNIRYSTVLKQWNVSTTLGPVYSNRRYHGYFYDVQQRDVIAGRHFFQSSSGYTASRFSISGNRRFNKLLIGGFIEYHDLSGAVNKNSPLVKKEDYFSAGLFVAWVFKQSEAYVDVD